MSKYLCMDCVHYMKCAVNAGVMCDFVKKAKVTYLEDRHKNHLLVSECDRFVKRDTITGETLPLPRYFDKQPHVIRFCNVCGNEFVVSKANRHVCSNPKCKEHSRKYRKSQQRKGA